MKIEELTNFDLINAVIIFNECDKDGNYKLEFSGELITCLLEFDVFHMDGRHNNFLAAAIANHKEIKYNEFFQEYKNSLLQFGVSKFEMCFGLLHQPTIIDLIDCEFENDTNS